MKENSDSPRETNPTRLLSSLSGFIVLLFQACTGLYILSGFRAKSESIKQSDSHDTLIIMILIKINTGLFLTLLLLGHLLELEPEKPKWSKTTDFFPTMKEAQASPF